MTRRTNVQVINNKAGLPEFVVLPYLEYIKITNEKRFEMEDAVPSEVVDIVVDKGFSSVKSWRIHLGLLPEDVAEKIGVSQHVYLQYERAKKLRKATLKKIAEAFGINVKQLRF